MLLSHQGHPDNNILNPNISVVKDPMHIKGLHFECTLANAVKFTNTETLPCVAITSYNSCYLVAESSCSSREEIRPSMADNWAFIRRTPMDSASSILSRRSFTCE